MRNRWTVVATGALVLAGVQVPATAPASAAPGMGELDLVEVAEVVSGSSVSPKTAIAVCPEDTVIIGGGGWVWASRIADDRELVMTQAQPVHSSTFNAYVVSGREVAGGFDGNWGVDAYALCGRRPAGYVLATDSVGWSSSTVKEAIASCPAGKRVLGTGARIDNSAGEVTLQTARSSGPRDIARAVAKEDASGYDGNWGVTAVAVCADPRSGVSVQYGGSALTGPENFKVASVDCPPGTFVYNAAASISGRPPGLLTGPPGVAILDINPEGGFAAHAAAIETTPTNASWDLAVQAICGP